MVDFESDDWEMHIDNVVANFKKAIELDKQKLKEFQVWRYTKLIEQIGYCYYKLGDKQKGEEYFEEVLVWYKRLPETDRVVPYELISCLPKKHPIVIEIKIIETYLD